MAHEMELLPEDFDREVCEVLRRTPRNQQAEAIDRICEAHPEHSAAIRSLSALLAFERQAQPAPSTIGPYRIDKLLGEGGMGTVYLAEQREPVRRRVAVKVVKAGMDTSTVLKRFDAERQALAAMNHDAIARVFDAGSTRDGKPYFVMEYVDGEPLDTYCDRHSLAIEDRLRLFGQICHGVQHAHQKSVIHRDLKPGNILVDGNGREHHPKIIDFGLARITDAQRDLTLTHIGHVMGTPEYMSPEQARGDSHLIDTRTDVYALGAILYQLLTGRLPFADDDRTTTDFLELQRRIREDEPTKPSKRATTVSERQHLSRQLRGDLDWIVMKALEKEPDRRYESASALAEDTRRYLDHEPVSAGPPSTVYRARKLLRRYRIQFAAGSIVLLAVVLGATLSILFAMRARASDAEARSNLTEWTRLADHRRLETLVDKAETLWPAAAAKIPELEAWLQEARELASKLPEHRAALAEIRKLADTDEARARTLDRLHYHRELTRLTEIERERKHASTRQERLAMRDEHRKLSAIVARRFTWTFANEAVAFRHGELRGLVDKLTSLTSKPSPTRVTIAGVERRLAAARKLERSRENPAFLAAWQRLITDVARRESKYGGLALEPIPGIMPLGIDRKTGFWELYHVASGAAPVWRGEPLGRGTVELDETNGQEAIVLVLLPGGTFHMGATLARPGNPVENPNVDARIVSWEEPVHTVDLDPFLIGKYEVTQGQWKHLYGTNPSYYYAGIVHGSVELNWRHPVTNMSWIQARDACRRWALRLPTEAQWEYACRAGTRSTYFTGNRPESLDGYANLADEVSASFYTGNFPATAGLRDGYPIHAPVGTFRPNPFGLQDMIGNVREWCRDEIRSYSIWKPRQGDGRRGLWTGIPRAQAIVRGGSHAEHADFARCASRVTNDARAPTAHVGFRVSRSLTP